MYERRNYLHMAYHESGEGGASPRESINLDGISSESQVSLRELRESDIDSIARIVQKTWFSAMDSPVPVSPDGEEKMDAPLFRIRPRMRARPAESFTQQSTISCGTSADAHILWWQKPTGNLWG